MYWKIDIPEGPHDFIKISELLKYKFKVNFRLYLIGKGYNFNLLSNFIKNSGLQKILN